MTQHPFNFSDQELKTIWHLPEDRDTLTNQTPKVGIGDEQLVTTQAVGEEGGDLPGEIIDLSRNPGISDQELVTTQAVGEEGGDLPGEIIDLPKNTGIGDEELVTTQALGEEGGDFSPEVADPWGGQSSRYFFFNQQID